MPSELHERLSEDALMAVAPLRDEALYRQTAPDLYPAVAKENLVKSYWRVILVALAAGALGVALTIMGLTMYQDHLRTTAMWDYMVKQSQAQAAKAQPTPKAPDGSK